MRLQEGDVVHLPNRGEFIVYEAQHFPHSPDKYQAERFADGQQITWRDHHVEKAVKIGADVLRGGVAR